MRLADRILEISAPKQQALFSEFGVWARGLLKPTKTNLRFTVPDVASALGLLLAAGLPVSVALAWLAPRAHGEIGEILSAVMENIALGADITSELSELAHYQDAGLNELAEKLLLMIERGAGVSHQIFELAASLRHALYRELLQKAGSNETKMLIPTVFLILPVTVLFALFPSLVVLQQSI